MNLKSQEYRLSITSACNMKCEYCHNEGNSHCSMLTPEDVDKILADSYNIGLKTIRLTGGDPLVSPYIEDICKLIKEKYGLKISINTNGILIKRILKLIEKKYISRVVIGLDYVDKEVSKNSPIGVPSKQILDNILAIKKTGINVSISTVFNDNYEDIRKIVEWGINNKVRVKVIEVENNEISDSSSSQYLEMQESIISDFNLDRQIDKIGETNGYIKNLKIVSFFHSLCRLRRCDICKDIQCRITSDGTMKACLYYNNQDENLLEEDNNRQKILRFINRQVDYHYDSNLVI